MEIWRKQSGESDPFSDLSFMNRLLSNTDALRDLSEFRKQNGNKPKLSENLRGCLEPIYHAFEPVATRLIKKRIQKFNFNNIDEDRWQDILGQQQEKLWKFIVQDFNWQNYSDARHAVASFIQYLDKSTGSSFVPDLIQNQKDSFFRRSSKKNIPLVRPPEDALIANEMPDRIVTAYNTWRKNASNESVRVVEKRYLDGQSVVDQAKEENIKESTLRARFIRAKKSLFNVLMDAEILHPENVLNGKLIVDGGSREDLLTKRREMIVKAFPAWEDMLKMKPKLKAALVSFYGLNGKAPTFDPKQTAVDTGISVQTVRMFVSEGNRLLAGQLEPSSSILNAKKARELYFYWKDRPEELQITSQDSLILNLYFHDNRTNDQIAKKLGISEESVRRKKINALSLIEVSRNTLNGN